MEGENGAKTCDWNYNKMSGGPNAFWHDREIRFDSNVEAGYVVGCCVRRC